MTTALLAWIHWVWMMLDILMQSSTWTKHEISFWIGLQTSNVSYIQCVHAKRMLLSCIRCSANFIVSPVDGEFMRTKISSEWNFQTFSRSKLPDSFSDEILQSWMMLKVIHHWVSVMVMREIITMTRRTKKKLRYKSKWKNL